MNFKKLICSVLMLAALCAAPLAASAAPVTAVRSSVSPARVRLVFDSTEPIKYRSSQQQFSSAQRAQRKFRVEPGRSAAKLALCKEFMLK